MNGKWVPIYVTIGLFEISNIPGATMAVQLRGLLMHLL